MKRRTGCGWHTLSIMFVSCGMYSISAMAADECDFTKTRGEKGELYYSVTSAYDPSSDTREVMDRYLKAAGSEGFLIASKPDFNASSPSFIIGKPPSPNPIMVTLESDKNLVLVTTIIPPGNEIDTDDEKLRLCKLNGVANGESAEKIEEKWRTAMPDKTPTMRFLSPTVPFDLAAAKKALEPGNSVIRGRACASDDRGVTYAKGSAVHLFPVTPYMEQLIELMKQVKSESDIVMPDDQLKDASMTATADSEGRFVFSKMKPGKYILMTSVSGVVGGVVDVNVGKVSNEYGSANIYRSEDHSRMAYADITKEVQIKKNGETVKVTMQPPIKLLQLKQGLRGSILGCRW